MGYINSILTLIFFMGAVGNLLFPDEEIRSTPSSRNSIKEGVSEDIAKTIEDKRATLIGLLEESKSKIPEMQKFQEVELDNTHLSSTGLNERVILKGFETNGGKVMFKVVIEQKTEVYDWTHKGRKLGPEGKRNGPATFTPKKGGGKDVETDIRIYMDSTQDGYKVGKIFGGTAANGTRYKLEWDTWTTDVKKRPPLNKASIDKIAKEAHVKYREHLRQ